MDSLAGDAQLTDKASENASASHSPSDIMCKLETQLKTLMTATGATSPQEVLQRFIAQKEASSRLNYLRTVTEGEKKHLEMQRDELMTQLEIFKFADTKENEVYVVLVLSALFVFSLSLNFGIVSLLRTAIKSIWKN